MRSQIQTEEGLKSNLLEDVFKLMDEHTQRYEEALERAKSRGWSTGRLEPDLLVSDVYQILTRSFYAPSTETDVRAYKFRGNYNRTARGVFETLLEELGFELYQAKGRAYRIKTIPKEEENEE